MNNKKPTTIRFTENQMKIIELLQDRNTTDYNKPSIANVVGFALENLLYKELDELKIFDVSEVEDYIDLITNEGLKNKLKDKYLLINSSSSNTNDTNNESDTSESLKIEDKPSFLESNVVDVDFFGIEDKPSFLKSFIDDEEDNK